jgi:hypothetical protein
VPAHSDSGHGRAGVHAEPSSDYDARGLLQFFQVADVEGTTSISDQPSVTKRAGPKGALEACTPSGSFP